MTRKGSYLVPSRSPEQDKDGTALRAQVDIYSQANYPRFVDTRSSAYRRPEKASDAKTFKFTI